MSWKTFGAWLLLLSVLVLGIAFLGYIFNNNTYKVYFDASGGNVIKPIEVKENELILKLPVTSRDGYKFIGWFLNDKLFELDTNITSNIYLVAKWEKIDQESFVIHFDSLNGEDIKDMQVKQDEVINLPMVEREGYEFIGWYYHNKEFDPEKVKIINNMTLVAKWQKKS